MDLNQLNELTPLGYLSRHVTICTSRRQLYDKVYTRIKSVRDGLLTEDAFIKGLGEVMGGCLSKDLISEIWSILGVKIAPHIENKFSYREFAGVAALVERVFCFRFLDSSSPGPILHKSEIEKADFDRLISKLAQVSANQSLQDLLIAIKDSGNIKIYFS
ncbi:uncharacterized protein LOC111714868 [Eurytemora carolleeae]|uniref:uncharacterized protein LOC111714868 n=1 Tax=Eurytemora carolleeae TaxID=1294199 RepID=UPI000C782A5E|nr:uncharacterized protein LOC111714868 [Eurytemora carolleeae]|eukprot:XP_023345850.1 uncharacterized protein LOC111714868 [Eurytemora affinis]